MRPSQPILVADLFPELEAALLDLLRGLDAADWQRPAAGAHWTVKDVAAHLLDTGLRRLSFQRDGHPLAPPPGSGPPIAGWDDLVAFINRLNADWVTVAKRLSPQVLIELLAASGPPLCDLLAGLDPLAPAIFGVAWAGEETSPNWFDVAREYTERWHHQQQIRDATGRPGLTSRRHLHPVLDAFLRALPHRYREIEAPEGTRLEVEIEGEAGGLWTLRREAEAWRLYLGRDEAAAEPATTSARIGQADAWRLFTKGLDRPTAEARLAVEGDGRLAEPLFDTVAVMA